MRSLVLLALLGLAVGTAASAIVTCTQDADPDNGGGNYARNGGFECNGLDEWHTGGSTLYSADYFNGPDTCDSKSAKIGNGKGSKIDKTYLEQSVFGYTRSGLYDFSFCYKASPDWTAAKSFLEAQFNHVIMNGTNVDEYTRPPDDEIDPGTATFPIDKGVTNKYGTWTCVELVANVPNDDLIADLRIRFHGHGFLIDYVTVKDADDE
jgi:hypothetical protein